MAQIQKGTTYSTGNATVTIDNLNAHVDNASLLPGAISDQNALAGNAAPATDQVLILASGQLKKASVVQALGGVTPSELLNRNNNLSDLADITTAKTNLSLNLVENKSSATIRSEITSANVTTALTYVPTSPTELATQINTRIATAQLGALDGVATLGPDGKLTSNQVAALNSTAQLAVLGTQALGAIGAQPLLSFPLTVAQGGTGGTTSTGTGSVVLQNSPALSSPTFTSPTLGTPLSGNLSNCTALPVSSITGILPVANGGTGESTASGTGPCVKRDNAFLNQASLTAPFIAGATLSNPILGTPASGNLSNCTNIPVANATGTLPVVNGGTGQTTYSNGQLLIGNGTGLTKATLTAGTNVSITNGAGSVTIASSVPAATTSQIGGFIPGSGLTMSGNVLNGIFPKAIASFSGIFANIINVSCLFSRTAGQNLITISSTNIVTAENIKVGHRIYFTFTLITGTNVPVTGIYTVASITDNNSFSISGGILTTAATGSANFKKCFINFSDQIDSIIYGGTAAQTGSYICNLSSNFSNNAYLPIVSISQLGAASGVSNPLDVYDHALDECGGALERTTNSFGFETYNATTIRDCGYYSGIIVFGNY